MSRGKKNSHSPSLTRIVDRTLREESQLSAGDRVLLAISGGGDSMAMLHVMARLAPKFGIGLFAHGVDHGLRPEAGSELDLAATLAAQLGIEFSRSKISVAHGSNLQSRARVARYEALEQRAEELGGALIATAHHADDRAETVILRMLRGSGLLGLGVLSARERQLLRPMIRTRRSDILAHLTRHGIEYASDPSNRNPHYLRVKVRQEILPALALVSPRIVEHLCAIADEAAASKSAGPELATEGLGRRQREALLRAIASANTGFELPLGNGLLLRLSRDSRQRGANPDPVA